MKLRNNILEKFPSNKVLSKGIKLFLIALISLVFIGFTYARYTSTGTGLDEARVAKWGVNFTDSVIVDMFDTTYADTSDVYVKTSKEGQKVIAPGTSHGNPFTLANFTGAPPETAYAYNCKMSVDPIQSETINKLDDLKSFKYTLQRPYDNELLKFDTYAELQDAFNDMSESYIAPNTAPRGYVGNPPVGNCILGFDWASNGISVDDTKLGEADLSSFKVQLDFDVYQVHEEAPSIIHNVVFSLEPSGNHGSIEYRPDETSLKNHSQYTVTHDKITVGDKYCTIKSDENYYVDYWNVYINDETTPSMQLSGTGNLSYPESTNIHIKPHFAESTEHKTRASVSLNDLYIDWDSNDRTGTVTLSTNSPGELELQYEPGLATDKITFSCQRADTNSNVANAADDYKWTINVNATGKAFTSIICTVHSYGDYDQVSTGFKVFVGESKYAVAFESSDTSKGTLSDSSLDIQLGTKYSLNNDDEIVFSDGNSVTPYPAENCIVSGWTCNGQPVVKGQEYMITEEWTGFVCTFKQKIGNDAPSQSNTLTYDGSSQSPEWSYPIDCVSQTSGPSTDTEANFGNDKVVEFTPKEGFCWDDGSTVPKSTSWKINPMDTTVSVVEGQNKTYGELNLSTYQTQVSDEYEGCRVVYSVARVEGEDAGDYTITPTADPDANPNYNVTCETGTFTINPRDISEATVTIFPNSYVYTGEDINISSKVSVAISPLPLAGTGITSEDYDFTDGYIGKDVDTYNLKLTGKRNFKDTHQSATWSITKQKVAIPHWEADNSVIYDGETHTVLSLEDDGKHWVDWDPDKSSVDAKERVDADSYPATFSLRDIDNYCWDDGTSAGTIDPQTKNWKILESPTAVPPVAYTTMPTYNKEQQNGYQTAGEHVDYTGDYQATDHKLDGDYSYTAVPSKNYAWSDGTKTVTAPYLWNIQKAPCTLSFAKPSFETMVYPEIQESGFTYTGENPSYTLETPPTPSSQAENCSLYGTLDTANNKVTAHTHTWASATPQTLTLNATSQNYVDATATFTVSQIKTAKAIFYGNTNSEVALDIDASTDTSGSPINGDLVFYCDTTNYTTTANVQTVYDSRGDTATKYFPKPGDVYTAITQAPWFIDSKYSGDEVKAGQQRHIARIYFNQSFNDYKLTSTKNLFGRQHIGGKATDVKNCYPCVSYFDGANFNTEKVVNATETLGYVGCLHTGTVTINGLDTWFVKGNNSITNISYFFESTARDGYIKFGKGTSHNMSMIKDWDVSKVTTVKALFDRTCSSREAAGDEFTYDLDFSGWETNPALLNGDGVVNYFIADTPAKKVYVGAGMDFSACDSTKNASCFSNAYKIVGQDGLTYNASRISSKYAIRDFKNVVSLKYTKTSTEAGGTVPVTGATNQYINTSASDADMGRVYAADDDRGYFTDIASTTETSDREDYLTKDASNLDSWITESKQAAFVTANPASTVKRINGYGGSKYGRYNRFSLYGEGATANNNERFNVKKSGTTGCYNFYFSHKEGTEWRSNDIYDLNNLKGQNKCSVCCMYDKDDGPGDRWIVHAVKDESGSVKYYKLMSAVNCHLVLTRLENGDLVINHDTNPYDNPKYENLDQLWTIEKYDPPK